MRILVPENKYNDDYGKSVYTAYCLVFEQNTEYGKSVCTKYNLVFERTKDYGKFVFE